MTCGIYVGLCENISKFLPQRHYFCKNLHYIDSCTDANINLPVDL